ncbi:MAG TPA: hypothetical protein VIM12_12440 [Noviherbaspirillum sp.]|jgi:hypothetical protein|uniref:hypothetical protein n=1 Tax=Noviherbaspirillum sp. TaxID=1926288 RepID=UPI002F94C232
MPFLLPTTVAAPAAGHPANGVKPSVEAHSDLASDGNQAEREGEFHSRMAAFPALMLDPAGKTGFLHSQASRRRCALGGKVSMPAIRRC